MLGFLISVDWVLTKPKDGVKVTDQEVVKHFNELKKGSSPRRPNFRHS